MMQFPCRKALGAIRHRLRGAALLLSCGLLLGLGTPRATAQSSGAAPDYARADAWLARPAAPRHGAAVFFVHPTSYFAPVIGNARYDQGGRAARFNAFSLRFQAASFATCCDIWVPQYRQASLRAIVTNSAAAYAADDRAYRDVARAFRVFLAGLHGRPFILAAHSQGSVLALRLLQEQILHQPLQRRMIAAYLPGLALPQAIAEQGLPICGNARATGCVVSWNSVRAGTVDRRRLQEAVIWWDGRFQPVSGRPIVCVNPVTWQPGGGTRDPGAISVSPALPAPVDALTQVSCTADGLLGITLKVEDEADFAMFRKKPDVFHVFDYNLFFAAIAANAQARVAAFLTGG